MLISLIKNHVFTNLVFVLVLFIGYVSYQNLPREQDPTINFNWIQVTTPFPGASAEDVEQKVTLPLEEAIEKIQDMKFVSSTSREGFSSILIRFQDVGDRMFDKRVSDLRREIQNVEDRLPEEVDRPIIFELTSSNAFPSATVLIHGLANDANLRQQARTVERDLARIKGVSRVQPTALYETELQIRFDIDKLQASAISPTDITNTIRLFFKDISAGSTNIAADRWLVRVDGTTIDPERIAQLPIIRQNVGQNTNQTMRQKIRIGDVAVVARARAKADTLVSYQGRPAVMMAVMKRDKANTLALVERINDYIEEKNKNSDGLEVIITLADDQTLITKNALNIMQTNAVLGLFFVLIITWLFLGSKISILITIGIPFTLAGTFFILDNLGQTLNTSVFLGIVIALGMLVDDAVVVVESIYNKLRHGVDNVKAVTEGLFEVINPVTASVLTTIAAFLPLMLMPGILGKFMMVIPLVVTLALVISLIEAFWMLPGHIMSTNINVNKNSKSHQFRQAFTHWIRVKYCFALIKVLRKPIRAILALFFLLALAVSALSAGFIKLDFFASDSLRLFYVNVTMPTSTSLQGTLDKVLEIETQVNKHLQDDEVRTVVSYAGQQYTETEPFLGEHYGQILVSLQPETGDLSDVNTIIEKMRADVTSIPGPVNISFLTINGGPPTSKAISVKVRGNDYAELKAATTAIAKFMVANGNYTDINDDDSEGRFGLTLTLNNDAIFRSGIRPDVVMNTIKALVDGEIAAQIQYQGDQIAIRVQSAKALNKGFDNIEDVLALQLPLANGNKIPLRELVNVVTSKVKGNLRHYNFKRTITLESDINKEQLDTVAANKLIQDFWRTIMHNYPNVDLDFSGELDDIEESMDAIGVLFLFGLALMYLILATQFSSYFQPLMILATVPMAFTGVILGLIVTGNPLSLYTLYGIVALAGIAVNSAIVLISKANSNIEQGMTLLHATFYAARRRMLPILITTFTTVAGLFSLATGLGGKSLIWAPVATSIVWGLMFSAVLSMFIVPAIYLLSMKRSYQKSQLAKTKE
ncbi:MAG: efflux RND transporter permease subunit [Colwellia sp.]|nr:efflux RND transporter permease subunit [Colwellia sp.]